MKSMAWAPLFLIGSSAATAGGPIPEPKTVAGVLAADDDWLVAEKRGDVAALDRRLADGYRDVDPDGIVHPKSELLGWTANRKDRATGSTEEIAAEFRRRNPAEMKVMIFGDTAIVSFHAKDPARQALVLSVDVFSYRDGIWQGVLSKHSSRFGPAPVATSTPSP